MINDNKKTEKDSASLREFIKDFIDDYNNRLCTIFEQKKTYMNDLSEKEAVISSIQKNIDSNSKLFSPNSKDYNIDEYVKEATKIKEMIEATSKEQNRIETIILYLQKLENMIIEHEMPHFNIGLNILEIQEQDRQRIARDLHDSTVQNLTSLIHKSELCSRLVDIDPVRTRLELTTISNTLKAVINEIREIIFNLKPMSLEDLGLIMTIERFTNQLMMHHDINIKLNYNEERNDILPVINLSIFRMIQEACNNAIKHAEAKCIEIDIQYCEKHINISIIDDGKGFDTNSLKDDRFSSVYSGCGLSMMKERVYLLSGTLDVKSTINKGTIVTITVPIM